MEKISIPIGHVDNMLDLANLLKKFFNAEVEILDEKSEYNGVAIVARLNYKRYFLDRLYNNVSSEFVKITVYVVGNSKIELDEDIVDVMTNKGEKKRDYYEFKTIKNLVNFLKFQLTKIDFPQINLDDLKQIDLSERDKILNQWKEAFEKLIPYGVVVNHQVNEKISDCDWIFEIEPPKRPVPKELAMKNKHMLDYHCDAVGQDYRSFNKSSAKNCEMFFPGDEDWNKQYQNIIDHLKKIYKVDTLKER